MNINNIKNQKSDYYEIEIEIIIHDYHNFLSIICETQQEQQDTLTEFKKDARNLKKWDMYISYRVLHHTPNKYGNTDMQQIISSTKI